MIGVCESYTNGKDIFMSAVEFETWEESLKGEVKNNILKYWELMKVPRGFRGGLDNENNSIENCPVGLIMVSRLLWTYSRAYQTFGEVAYLNYAESARDFLLDVYRDQRNGGFFWEANEGREILSTKKLCYGQAFVVYALSEHAIATKSAESVSLALELYQLIEDKCWDDEKAGYIECFEAEWMPSETMKLGKDDLDAPKTMNNHLHMIEAYANLLKLTGDENVKNSCIRLMRTIMDYVIISGENRFGLYYDMDWKLLDGVVSPGHDIEGSWLLWEAVEIIGDESLMEETRGLILIMAEEVLRTGLDADGAVLDEIHPGETSSKTRTWWPQAEAMVGFFNAYQLTDDERFANAASVLWNYINDKIIDHENGEWYWGIDENGTPLELEKAGPWKSAYHNGRACMEMIERIRLLKASA